MNALLQTMEVRVADMPVRVRKAIKRDRHLKLRYGEEETRRINNAAAIDRMRSWFSGQGKSSKRDKH